MSKTIPFKLENSDGKWTTLVSLEEQGNFIFNRREIKFLDITVFEAGPNVGTETYLCEHGLELRIPLTPEQLDQFELNPTATFEIVNDFELEEWEGVKLDKWIVTGPDWSRDVYNDQDNDLNGGVLYTFFPPDGEEAIAA